jgi:hypothetical protein
MTKSLKTPQIAANGFMGYGGCNPPYRQLPLVPSLSNSRALTWRYASKVVARPADGFGVLRLLRVTGFSRRWSDTRQRVDAALAEFLRCACLITCTLLSPRGKTHQKIKALYPLPVLDLGVEK